MRPVQDISDRENFRLVPLPGGTFVAPRRDSIEPEPVGTIVLMAFRVTGYDRDCDGSLMARLEHVNKDGQWSGWSPKNIGIDKDSTLVLTEQELKKLFE